MTMVGETDDWGSGSGDPTQQFLCYFNKDRNRIYALVYSLVLNEVDAEEVFQRCSRGIVEEVRQLRSLTQLLRVGRRDRFS